MFSYSLAAALAFAGIYTVADIAQHGFSFFTFREAGQGETPGLRTDAVFLAQQAAAAHHTVTPTGKHHKTTSG